MNLLITGGVGFIGTNCCHSFNSKNNHITIVDDFSRPGVEKNAEALKKTITNLSIIQANINDTEKYTSALKKADVIIHLAGQTAVTTSIQNPQKDFESNILGSFRLLEAVREHNPHATVLYSSTNKVYGDLRTDTVEKNEDKKIYENHTHPNGIDESAQIDFISPYGCSKGAIDFYVQDYWKSYGIKTVVFRQSCIYGPFQIGVEDQGWVAHFSKQVLTNNPITIFGDGYQVRDLLYVEDLTDLYKRAIENIDRVKGEALNVGGGTGNSFSLIQVLDILEKETGHKPRITIKEERLGDQKYFASANTKAKKLLDWEPTTKFENGVKKMIEWQKDYLR